MMWPLVCLIAFVVGSFPTGLVIGRMHGIDIRKHGSGNIGATNVGRVLGPKAWIQCFSVDLLKGFIPTLMIGWWAGLMGRWVIEPGQATLWLIAMLMPILGHMFSPWLKFKGGKGVATGLGTILAVYPTLTFAGVLALAVFLIALARWKYVSLGSILAGITLPVAVVIQFIAFYILRDQMFPAPGPELPWTALVYFVLTFTIATLVFVKHRANVTRLKSGTEPKIGQRKRPVAG